MADADCVVRIQPSVWDDLRERADKAGLSVEQFVNAVVAEKLAALRSAAYFRERAARGSAAEALAILELAGTDEPPRPGDEWPAGQNRFLTP
jgi:hypothetical protein